VLKKIWNQGEVTAWISKVKAEIAFHLAALKTVPDWDREHHLHLLGLARAQLGGWEQEMRLIAAGRVS